MFISDGKYFSAATRALNLPKDQLEDATRNAKNIVAKVLEAYTRHYGPVSANGPSTITHSSQSATAGIDRVTGLVYGRIQSGKTRAMIASTAMAFDNGVRIVVVLTSNINDLVDQTHFDFASGLPGVMVYTKDDELAAEIGNARLELEAGDGCVLIICSKGPTSLRNVISFLRQIGAEQYPAIIFDDEGDQASLDTNTRKRSMSNVAVAASTINSLIQQDLKRRLPRNVYVSVTGTPQAVLLQSADSVNRPSFIELLSPGNSYVGGTEFFPDDEPESNGLSLIRIADRNEKDRLLNPHTPIPDGLRHAILFFLVAWATAIKKGDLATQGKGCSFLCHPSLKNDEQAVAAKRIGDFLLEVKATLLNARGANQAVLNELEEERQNLKLTVPGAPPLTELSPIILEGLKNRKILVINARAKRQGIAYGPGLNFLIGGNTLGRGIAIPDLLVTYYLRDSKVSQIDTMHQHARMFGYRKKTLPYTRLFVPRHLYYRFRDIHRSDADLREFIQEHQSTPKTFPIEFTFDLRTTRGGVLDVNTTDTLQPRMQVYPNYVIVPQTGAVYARVEKKLLEKLGPTKDLLASRGRKGVIISVTDAVGLATLIKTKSDNTWRDKTIDAVIEKIAGSFGDKVTLKFRKAHRVIGKEGFMSTGTLSGDEYEEAKAADIPTLWVMSVETAPGSFHEGQKFMYPTFVIPKKLPKLLMFSKA